MKHIKAYATSTACIIQKMLYVKPQKQPITGKIVINNSITKSSYCAIIGNRIDRLELHRLQQENK